MDSRKYCFASAKNATAFLLGLLFISGCGTLRNNRGWGQDATLAPGAERIKRAFKHSIADPGVYAPLAGAAIFTIGRWDENTARWASEKTPVYGSRGAAERKSDQLTKFAAVGAIATAALTPSGAGDPSDPNDNAPLHWVWWKLKGGAVESAAVATSLASTAIIKNLANRPRPDDSDNKSFPSGHSVEAFSCAALGRRNLQSIPMAEPVREALGAGFTSMAAATAWARIEAGVHYPSDVLAGAALANFLTAFIHDAFLGTPWSDDAFLYFEPMPDGKIAARLGFLF